MNGMRVFAGLLSLGLVLGVQQIRAEEVKMSGQACWNGQSRSVGTGKADFGMTWELHGTYLDDAQEANNSNFHCVGIGGMVGGKPQASSWWCLSRFADGATALSRASAKPDGTTEDGYVSGTGSHEGVVGSWTGSVATQIGSAPPGTFAGCRKLEGSKTLKSG